MKCCIIPIIEINTLKCHGNVKILSHNHNQYLLLYKAAEHLASGLGRFWECRKWNILVITQALVLCLIYTHSPSGAARPRASCVYIRQSTLACVITITYIYIYIYKHHDNWYSCKIIINVTTEQYQCINSRVTFNDTSNCTSVLSNVHKTWSCRHA